MTALSILRRLGGTIVLSAIPACSLTLEFQQCRDDTDCMNDEGVELVCGGDNECIPRPNPSEVSCESNAECASVFDADHVCGPSATCASLLTNQCTKLYRPSNTAPEDIVWIGSLLATSPPFDSSIVPIENAVRLAVEDFNSVTRLPSNKRVGWIGCDSAGRSQLAVQAATHLVENVGVPAIIGPSFSATTIAVAEQVAVPNGTFVISPTASSSSITNLDDEGLVWRTISSDVYQAHAIVDRLAELDPVPERLLILAKNDAYGQGLLQDMRDRLVEQLPGVKDATLLYPDPATFSSNDELLSAYGTVIAEGFPHDADTVLFLGTSEVRDLTLFYLAIRDDQADIPTLPRFLYSHGGVPLMPAIIDAVSPGFRPTLMAALEGVSPIIQDAQNFEAYNIRYKIRFSDQEPLSASSLGYDSAMVTLFAMLTVEGTPITGVGIAQGMTRLVDPSAEVVNFRNGLSFVTAVSDALAAGQNVDLQGVSGALDFDLVAGEPRTDLIGWSLVPRDAQPDQALLVPARRYVLDPPPAATGTWMDL